MKTALVDELWISSYFGAQNFNSPILSGRPPWEIHCILYSLLRQGHSLLLNCTSYILEVWRVPGFDHIVGCQNLDESQQISEAIGTQCLLSHSE